MDAKVAIVTGGTKGIGLACADAFAADGYRVLICSRSAEEAERVAAGLSRIDGQVRGTKADLADPDVGVELVGICTDWFGSVDCVVNNAGLFSPTPMVEITAAKWDETLHTNLRGAALLSSAAARAMRSDSGCSIVNIASINGLVAEDNFAAYNASKAGLVSLTQTTAVEWAADDIRVNCVAPGWIQTPLSEPWIGGLSQRDIDRMIPMGRIGEPSDIASVVVFLASDGARYITGQTITVDGGMLTRQPAL
jgi:3-oxoacyl-[acyl-carrier protein] reductase